METETNTVEKLKVNRAKRFDRMRMGQSVADLYRIPSDNSVVIALVPLLEKELHEAHEATAIQEFPFTVLNARLYDRWEQYEVLLRSCREPDDIDKQTFSSVEQMLQVIEPVDINYLGEQYVIMCDRSSPSIEGFSEEQIDELKKVLTVLDWNELSGKQWYLLKSFLSSLSPEQLVAKFVGSSLTNLLTQTTDAISSALSANQKSKTTNTVPDAESNQESSESSPETSNVPRPTPLTKIPESES